MSPSEGNVTLIETGRCVVYPWHCDANGHLNTRHIQGFFDDACRHLLALCGHEDGGADRLSVVDVRCTMEYQAEAAAGALAVIRSGFRAMGRKSFTSFHEMRSMGSDVLYSTCETVSVFFDLDNRVGVPMPTAFREQAGRLLLPAGPITE